jgi:hypothetical protein
VLGDSHVVACDRGSPPSSTSVTSRFDTPMRVRHWLSLITGPSERRRGPAHLLGVLVVLSAIALCGVSGSARSNEPLAALAAWLSCEDVPLGRPHLRRQLVMVVIMLAGPCGAVALSCGAAAA